MVNLGVDNLWSLFDPPSEMHLNTPKSRTQHPDAIMGPGNQLGARGIVVRRSGLYFCGPVSDEAHIKLQPPSTRFRLRSLNSTPL